MLRERGYELDGFMLPDPRLLTAEELRSLFLKVSAEFTSRLAQCKHPGEIKKLENLQEYLKWVSNEIALKDVKVFGTLPHLNSIYWNTAKD